MKLLSELSSNVFLAPMAGITDLVHRRICKRMGAGLVYTEMVSAKGLYYKDDKIVGVVNYLMK